jgi:hypothetical protein
MLSELIQSFPRTEIVSGLHRNQKPLIVLPIEMYDATLKMCRARNEVRGIMFYMTSADHHIVRHMINIACGSPVEVSEEYTDIKKLNAANQLLHEKPDLKYIEYHTHTIGTGQIFYDRFSGMGGDIGVLLNRLEKNPNYMHVLFTPTHILTFGVEKPGFAITTAPSSTIGQEMTEIDTLYRQILSKQK